MEIQTTLSSGLAEIRHPLHRVVVGLRIVRVVNTSFVARNNGTARYFNARKQRNTYCFSKQLAEHEAMSWLTLTHYNFCRANRTLHVKIDERSYTQRSPAMTECLSYHLWGVEEFRVYQVGTGGVGSA
jgi:hypothetical protein